MRLPLLPIAGLLCCAPSLGQIVNPAERSASRDSETQTTVPAPEEQDPELIVVTPGDEPVLREEDRFGPYNQPVWTDRRLFPSTRVYVRAPGTMEFEYWNRIKVPKHGAATVETMYEVEFGLPGRMQLDLYTVTSKEGSEGELNVSEQKAEIRYALADWGELWMNPTLYLEYVSRDNEPDKAEYKLLLADEIAPSWHLGVNLVLEHELGGALENEYGVTMGLAHTVIDNKLSIGAELKAAYVDTHADRGNYTKELEIGPSLRYRPNNSMHVDFAPLIGIGHDSREADIYLVLGWTF
ncbi:MAG: hypothetical protein R3F17_02080 [Planctomycetota bacterium]